MNRYNKYKDSGVEWIGDIPEGWEIVPIKYALEIPITDGPHETPEILNEGIPFLSAEAVKTDKLDFKKKRGYISILDHERFSLKYKPQRGDVYMVKSGATTGNIARVETDEEFSIWSPLAALRPRLDVMLANFLFFFMKSKPFLYSVELSWNYGTQQNIGMGVISNLLMTLPPVAEQTAIANYLDRKTAEIDQLIAQKERLLSLYEEEKTAIINQAVTKGINPDVETLHATSLRDSGIDWLGEIPEHWEVKRLKCFISKVGSGITPKGGASVYQLTGVPLLRSQNIHFGGLKLDDVAYIPQKIHDEMSNSRVFNGDVLLNITGASIGRCFYVTDSLGEANVNQHVCILRPTIHISTEFLYFILRSNLGQEQINLEQTGSGREGLNFEALKNFIMPSPELSEQTAIVQHIETETTRINAKITKTKKIIALQKEYRTALISEVVTGKIKVTQEVAS